jgi:hypothetical protein
MTSGEMNYSGEIGKRIGAALHRLYRRLTEETAARPEKKKSKRP